MRLVARVFIDVYHFQDAVGLLKQRECIFDLVALEELQSRLVQLKQDKWHLLLRNLQLFVIVLTESLSLTLVRTLLRTLPFHLPSFL